MPFKDFKHSLCNFRQTKALVLGGSAQSEMQQQMENMIGDHPTGMQDFNEFKRLATLGKESDSHATL